MTKPTLFGRCADYLELNNEALADIIAEHSDRPCDTRRAERIRQGWEPVPAYAWTGLRRVYNGHCSKAEELIQHLQMRGRSRFLVTVADMDCPEMGPILIRAILQLPAGMIAAYDPYAPRDVITWGFI